jgi:hypothetical protein
LVKIEEFVRPDACEYHETTYYEEIKKFRAIHNQIGTQLVLTSPYQEKSKREIKKNHYFVLNEGSKRVLKHVEKMNQPAFAMDAEKDNNMSSHVRKHSNGKLVLKTDFTGELSKNTKRRSLSPTSFRPKPAVSAHKPPQLTQRPIKS